MSDFIALGIVSGILKTMKKTMGRSLFHQLCIERLHSFPGRDYFAG